jgi:general secretion pathway protein D
MTSSRSRSTTTYPSSTAMGGATVSYDQETRKLIVITDDNTAQNIGQVITNLNRPAPQVLINVVFLEVTHRKGSDIGVEGNYRKSIDNQTTATILQQFQGLPGLTSGNGIFNVIGSNYEATLRLLAEAGKLEVLSRPSILARNNQQATITVGQSVPLVTGVNYDSFGNQRNAIEYRDIGIILNVTPFVTSNGLVEMIVSPEISNLSDKTVNISTGTNSVGTPIINQRSADTVVVTPDGQTVIIGGLMQTTKKESQSKIPVLGDIPILGWAFRRTVTDNEKTELLIFLTPHVVKENTQLASMTRNARTDTEVVPKAFSEEELNRFIDGVPVKEPTPPAKKKKTK